MSQTIAVPTRESIWMNELGGKTIVGIRPVRETSPVPQVRMIFTDGSEYLVEPRAGVYFEGCLINTLRRAQPITEVVIERDEDETYVELRAKTFPLLEMRAVNRTLPRAHFPFLLISGGELRG